MMIGRLIVQTIVWFGAIGVQLFLSAGTIHWPGAWIFLAGLVCLCFVVGVWLIRHDAGPLRESLASPIQKDQPLADKIRLSFILLFLFGLTAISAKNSLFAGAYKRCSRGTVPFGDGGRF